MSSTSDFENLLQQIMNNPSFGSGFFNIAKDNDEEDVAEPVCTDEEWNKFCKEMDFYDESEMKLEF